MAIVYLEPDDLSAAQQARILRVINFATDAPALAAAIELAGEPDVGLRLAERLLRARATLNGQFSTLAQIDAVSGIGPERFTDLCVAILGLQREQLARLGQLAGHRLSEAQAQGFHNASIELHISIDLQPAWLGQTLQLSVSARQNGVPLINRTLTLETSHGILCYSFGFAQTRGNALQVRTGADGRARVSLEIEADEPLTLDQKNALQMALQDLDPAAETPGQIRPGFSLLAERYDDERNIHLRRAIDIYSRQQDRFWQRFNATNAEYEWPQSTAVVRAYLHGSQIHQAVVATAVALIRWQNWVPAWFVFLHDWLANRAALPGRFAEIKRRGARGYALVDSLIGEAHMFVAGQKGFAAELVSQHLVKDSVTRFLSTQLDDVGDDTKRVLFPSLELAAEQIRRGNRGSLELVANTRGQLKADLADIVAIEGRMLQEMQGIRDTVNLRAADVQAHVAQIEREVGAFRTDYASFNRNYASFNSNYSTFNTQYATFNTNYATFNTNYATFNTDYSTFNRNYTSFDRNYSAFNTNYAGFNRDYTRFNTEYSTFNQNRSVLANQVATLSTSVSQLQTQNTQLAQQITTVNQGLTQAQTDISGINRRITRGPT